MAGIPQIFESRGQFDELVASLVAVEMITDASKIYWDARPSSHAETLEFRVADVCPTVDETVMVAGLSRALTMTCLEEFRAGKPLDSPRPELLQAARWRASRFGLDGDLIDVHAKKSVPSRDVIEGLLSFVRPALELQGDWEEVSGIVHKTLDQGNSASRQRWAFAQAGRLEDVIDLILRETMQGL